VLAHGRALLADEERTTVITADIRDPDAIFDNPTTRDLIDYDKPYAVLAVSILHHLHDEDALVTAEALKARLRPGACLLPANARRRRGAHALRRCDGLQALRPSIVATAVRCGDGTAAVDPAHGGKRNAPYARSVAVSCDSSRARSPTTT
jgi:S-adenosyl methyltransferase